MDYTTVFTTKDHTEVSVIKGLFEQEKLHFKILDENRELDVGEAEVRIQVSEEDRVRAREILHEGGLLGGSGKAVAWHTRRKPVKKWIFVFLAALIVVLVAFLVMWFMSAE